MTQDAPLDQTAPIDADVLRKLVPGFRLDWSGLRNRFDDIAARLDKLTTYESRAAYLDEIARNFEDAVSDALSRRVPASGELNERLSEILDEDAPNKSVWKTFETQDEWLRDKILPLLRDIRAASSIVAAPEGWPIKLDMVTSSQFVARVQSDALTTIALPMIEELSKRPQTVWGDIVKALRSKAEELWHAPSIPEGKAEPQP